MLTVIQSPIGWSLLAWVAFVPFISVCCRDYKPRRFFLVTYAVSVCYWAINLYWIFPVTIVGGILTCGIAPAIVGVVGLIEGIIYLTKPDDEFVQTYVDNERPWF